MSTTPLLKKNKPLYAKLCSEFTTAANFAPTLGMMVGGDQLASKKKKRPANRGERDDIASASGEDEDQQEEDNIAEVAVQNIFSPAEQFLMNKLTAQQFCRGLPTAGWCGTLGFLCWCPS